MMNMPRRSEVNIIQKPGKSSRTQTLIKYALVVPDGINRSASVRLAVGGAVREIALGGASEYNSQ